MFTTLQNTPITIDLTQQGNSTGWTISGSNAIHEVCNAGSVGLINYPITAGLTYQVSYRINSINSGNVQLSLGGISSLARTTVNNYTDTITSINSNPLSFYSNANADISLVNVRITTNVFDNKTQETIVWSEKNNKWSDFRGYNPDEGFSLFANMFTYKNGQLHAHSASNGRNNFYGQQYKSVFKFVANAGKTQPKTFESISYEANDLMITTTDGIQTSLGKISELIDQDFLKDVLDDGLTQVNIWESEGIYSAGFMKAKPDLINGSPLKGTHITIELLQVNEGVLKLSNVYIHSERSAIGSR